LSTPDSADDDFSASVRYSKKRPSPFEIGPGGICALLRIAAEIAAGGSTSVAEKLSGTDRRDLDVKSMELVFCPISTARLSGYDDFLIQERKSRIVKCVLCFGFSELLIS